MIISLDIITPLKLPLSLDILGRSKGGVILSKETITTLSLPPSLHILGQSKRGVIIECHNHSPLYFSLGCVIRERVKGD